MNTVDVAIQQKIDRFFEDGKHQSYKKGEILVRADEDPSGIFYLKKGEVKVYAISKKGQELIINIFKPISFFPMSWAMNSTKNQYYFEAVTEVEVQRVGKEETIKFIQSNPDVVYDLLKRVYIGTDGLIQRMVYLMSEDAYDRVIVELIIHCKRFGKKINGVGYQVETSEKEIAARSGLTRESISRVIKKLKDKKLVVFDKGVLYISDINELEAELDQDR